jgi:hypothetical protein
VVQVAVDKGAAENKLHRWNIIINYGGGGGGASAMQQMEAMEE